jgi:hypothetical protein
VAGEHGGQLLGLYHPAEAEVGGDVAEQLALCLASPE